MYFLAFGTEDRSNSSHIWSLKVRTAEILRTDNFNTIFVDEAIQFWKARSMHDKIEETLFIDQNIEGLNDSTSQYLLGTKKMQTNCGTETKMKRDEKTLRKYNYQ